MPTSQRERAFTVHEVLVAGLLLMVIGSSIALAVTSAGRMSFSVREQARADSRVSAVFERLEAQPSAWASPCATAFLAGETSCDVTSKVDFSDLAADRELDVTWAISVVARGEDSPSDGLMSSADGDRDGLVPDFLHVTVKLSLSDLDQARLGGHMSRTAVRTYDGRGKRGYGSLVVEVCKVENQVDERLAADGCVAKHSSAQPLGVCIPQDTEGCEILDALKSAQSNSEKVAQARSLSSREQVGFQLVSQSGTYRSGTDCTWIEEGKCLFKRLPIGAYTISAPESHGSYRLWWSKVRPSKLQVSVQEGTRSDGLIMYRPTGRGEIDFQFLRTVSFINWESASHTTTLEPLLLQCSTFTPVDALNTHEPTSVCDYAVDSATVYFLRPVLTQQEWGGAANSLRAWSEPSPWGREVIKIDGPNAGQQALAPFGIADGSSIGSAGEDPDDIGGACGAPAAGTYLHQVRTTATFADGFVGEANNGLLDATSQRGKDVEHLARLCLPRPGLWQQLHITANSNRLEISDGDRHRLGLGSAPYMWVPPGGTWKNNPFILVRGDGECYAGMANPVTYAMSSSPTAATVEIPAYEPRMMSSCSASSVCLWWAPANGYLSPCGATYAYNYCFSRTLRTIIQYEDGTSSTVDTDFPTECEGSHPPNACIDQLATQCSPTTFYVPTPTVDIPPDPNTASGAVVDIPSETVTSSTGATVTMPPQDTGWTGGSFDG